MEKRKVYRSQLYQMIESAEEVRIYFKITKDRGVTTTTSKKSLLETLAGLQDFECRDIEVFTLYDGVVLYIGV